MKNYNIFWIWISIMLISSCKDLGVNEPLSLGDKPGQVSIISQKELAGGAEIIFKAPQSKDFTYVKAVYFTGSAENKVTSSLYEDKIVLTGFVKEGIYPVTFYAVSKGGVESDPLEVNVTVAKPSFLDVFENLQIVDDFSGFTVLFQNASEQDVRITVLTYDPLVKRYVTEYTHFSNDIKGSFRRAGYTQPQEFRFVVTDRWGNNSDTLSYLVKPLEELEMPKSKFASHPLPPFNNLAYTSATLFSRIWDGRIGNFYYGDTGWMSSQNGPIDFCIDIGVKAKLSRVKMNHACSPGGNHYFTAFNRYSLRNFELYGSNDPDPDGTWESWNKLSDYESIRPTGMSTEEIRFYGCTQGEDFFVPGEATGYRYYRFKVSRQWGGTTFFSGVDELSFYGALVD